MSTAVIDNATLTAVQRVTGQVASRSRDSIEVDLVAYENYLQARLFYDDVVAIDDYLPQHQQSRKKAFPQLTFVDPTNFGIKELVARADRISESIRPVIRGGHFANEDFVQLFELLQTHMICTWDIASSIYHLNLKVLASKDSEEFEKYGAVATSIFQELNDARETGRRVKGTPALLDRSGKPITPEYRVPGAKWGNGESGPPSKAISAFSASLVWLANRACYYSLVSAQLKADSFLYPIRQAYQQHFLAQTLRLDANFPKRVVSQLSATLSRDIVEIHNGGTLITGSIDLPVFSAWFMHRCGDTSAALFALEEIRLEAPFVEARRQLNELRELYLDKTLTDANKKAAKLTANLTRVSSAMRQKYSVQTKQGVPLTRLVSIVNAFTPWSGLPPLPKVDVSIPVPQWLRDIRREFGFCAVYRNLVNDLATFGSLGELRDILSKRVVIDKDLPAYSPKAEDPKYRYAHSEFKSPM
jgi:hypothetical protein